MRFGPSHPTPLRVLVAAHDRDVLTIAGHGLEQAGVKVIAAGDGTSALRRLVDHLLDLDLLVTELELPVLDGRTLVRVVRAEGGETELPIMVLATAVDARDRELLSRLGATEVVEKRRGVDHVVERIIALASAGHERRLRSLGGGAAGTPAPLGRVRIEKQRWRL